MIKSGRTSKFISPFKLRVQVPHVGYGVVGGLISRGLTAEKSGFEFCIASY